MSLTISLIQTNLFWENKEANLQMLGDKILSIQEKTEFIILPEMFSTGFTMHPQQLAEPMEGKTFQWMKEMSLRKRAVIAGSFIVQENDKYFNRLVCMLPNGQCGYYDKRHLFSFAGEHEHYSSGNKRLIASLKGWKINLQICYDLRFPVWGRQQQTKNAENKPDPEYDVLVYVANWPERRRHAWQTLLSARAIENQSFVVGINRVGTDGNDVYHSGNSMLIDPLGEVFYHMADAEDIYTTTLYKDHLEGIRTKYGFLADADEFRILNEE